MERLAKGALNFSIKKRKTSSLKILKKSKFVMHGLLWGRACGLKWEREIQ